MPNKLNGKDNNQLQLSINLMKRQISVLLIMIVLAGASSASDNLRDALKQRYKNHVLGLRSPFQKGDQEFDSAGKPLKDPDGSLWIHKGGIGIEDIKLDATTLRIKCRQVVYASGGRPKKNQKSLPGQYFSVGKSMNIVIHLDHPLNSVDEAQDMLGSIFFPDSNREPVLPQYQRTAPPQPHQILKVKEDHVEFPVPIYTPDPDYSLEARNQKYQGTVTLGVVVDAAGEVAWITVEQALGMGLDEQAVEKVKTWKFKPAHTKSGEAVAVRLNVEVSFNLY